MSTPPPLRVRLSVRVASYVFAYLKLRALFATAPVGGKGMPAFFDECGGIRGVSRDGLGWLLCVEVLVLRWIFSTC